MEEELIAQTVATRPKPRCPSRCYDPGRMAWKPSLNPGVALLDLSLTPEEGFVAYRLDGATDVQGLAVATGLPLERVEAALEKLVSLGAVSPRPGTPGELPAEAEAETEDDAET